MVTSIEQTLLDMLGKHISEGLTLAVNTDFVSGLGLESIQVMEFIMEVEEQFDIAIDLDTLSNVRSVDGLAAVVAKATGGVS
ncbi:MAG: acyl carrier protein [Xanthomonadaceae bacterium]|nr:acyl carrier protein [Xanthomonadaceae bacterium]MDP2184987.1 acyl carrier protein [Xanthomonadales bacterium]MDZ4117338.1 acyl carrier protein [Xanthomonadaceae bacterium]MDZ4377669.1 acyl carrier protein [Xanthomonadaceae bacterium]